MFSRLNVNSDRHSLNAPEYNLQGFQRLSELHRNSQLQKMIPENLKDYSGTIKNGVLKMPM